MNWILVDSWRLCIARSCCLPTRSTTSSCSTRNPCNDRSTSSSQWGGDKQYCAYVVKHWLQNVMSCKTIIYQYLNLLRAFCSVVPTNYNIWSNDQSHLLYVLNIGGKELNHIIKHLIFFLSLIFTASQYTRWHLD